MYKDSERYTFYAATEPDPDHSRNKSNEGFSNVSPERLPLLAKRLKKSAVLD